MQENDRLCPCSRHRLQVSHTPGRPLPRHHLKHVGTMYFTHYPGFVTDHSSDYLLRAVPSSLPPLKRWQQDMQSVCKACAPRMHTPPHLALCKSFRASGGKAGSLLMLSELRGGGRGAGQAGQAGTSTHLEVALRDAPALLDLCIHLVLAVLSQDHNLPAPPSPSQPQQLLKPIH